MPNNRHRAIERYTRSRYIKRLRNAARRAFQFPDNYLTAARMADIVLGDDLKLLPETRPIIMPPGFRTCEAQLAIAITAFRHSEHGHRLIVIDDRDGFDSELQKKHPLRYQKFIDQAYREIMYTGKMPEIKIKQEEGR